MLIPNHPDDEWLSAFAADDPEAVDPAQASHVASCERCTAVVTELASLRMALAELPDLAPSRPLQLVPAVPSGSATCRSRWWLGAAVLHSRAGRRSGHRPCRRGRHHDDESGELDSRTLQRPIRPHARISDNRPPPPEGLPGWAPRQTAARRPPRSRFDPRLSPRMKRVLTGTRFGPSTPRTTDRRSISPLTGPCGRWCSSRRRAHDCGAAPALDPGPSSRAALRRSAELSCVRAPGEPAATTPASSNSITAASQDRRPGRIPEGRRNGLGPLRASRARGSAPRPGRERCAEPPASRPRSLATWPRSASRLAPTA